MNHNYSLIIPHYNIPDKLRRLLNSVPHRDDLQIIVVDDMSTKHLDELEKVRGDYPWVEWYNTGTNGGGGKARNIGLEHAKGDYVFFADSDDYFLPELTNLLDKYSTSEDYPDIVFCNAIAIIEETGEKSDRADFLHNLHDVVKYNPARGDILMRYYFSAPWCKLIKREIIVQNKIECGETPIYNDVKLSYMVGWYCKSSDYYTEPIYILTQSPHSISYTANMAQLLIKASVHAEKFDFLSAHRVEYIDPDLFGPIYVALTHLRPKEFVECVKIYLRHGMRANIILHGFVAYTMNALAVRFLKKDPKVLYL